MMKAASMLQTRPAICMALLAIIAITQGAAIPTTADPLLIDTKSDKDTTPALSLPEIIPGPGLPSLASLNVTSTDLYAMPVPPNFSPSVTGRSASPASMQKRAQFCYDFYSNKCSTFWAVGCYNYLNMLGTTACGGGTSWFTMCSVGACTVSGHAQGTISVSSYCRDVAFGVSVIAYTCPHDSWNAGAGEMFFLSCASVITGFLLTCLEI
ncbi:hypothetical protein VTL71DRAFT_10258 [Oculimacula yallundae]|uniref:Uncharacterized protein n=1 Tax=Oculimacula yallundae TaxID=86028 RepID=A0ABR4CV24_9HELO